MRNTHAGFTLVEIVVAAAIISFSLTSMVAIASNSIGYSRRSLDTYAASASLEEGMEVVRMFQRNGWSTVSGLTENTPYYLTFATAPDAWSLSTTPHTDGILTRTVTFAPVYRSGGQIVTDGSGSIDTGTRLVTVTVSWSESGTTVSKTLSAYISDIYS